MEHAQVIGRYPRSGAQDIGRISRRGYLPISCAPQRGYLPISCVVKKCVIRVITSHFRFVFHIFCMIRVGILSCPFTKRISSSASAPYKADSKKLRPTTRISSDILRPQRGYLPISCAPQRGYLPRVMVKTASP